jgi:hypothetical protein
MNRSSSTDRFEILKVAVRPDDPPTHPLRRPHEAGGLRQDVQQPPSDVLSEPEPKKTIVTDIAGRLKAKFKSYFWQRQ